MNRSMLSLIGALLLVVVGAPPTLALQEATPEATGGLADVGMPQISVNVTADAIEGIPPQLQANCYLLIVTAAEETAFGGGVAFVRPEGVSVEEFLGAMAGPPAETGAGAAATPRS